MKTPQEAFRNAVSSLTLIPEELLVPLVRLDGKGKARSQKAPAERSLPYPPIDPPRATPKGGKRA
jgi:hypothetical protein